MRRHAVEPGTVHMSSVLTVLEKASAWEAALLAFDDMDRTRVDKNVITYTALTMALSRGGRWDAALEVVDSLRGSGEQLNELAFTAAIIACWSGKQAKLALRYKLEMVRQGLQPYFTTYLYLASALAGAADWVDALFT